MSLDNFIPEVWANELLVNLNNEHVYANPGIINRDYEGEIRQAGDTVRISSIGRVTIGTYTKNTDIAAAETLNDAQAALLIDQQKYFNFQIDDVDQAQQRPQVMSAAMRESSYGLTDVEDQFIAGLYTDADASNLIGSTASPKTDVSTVGAYVYLVNLKVLLDTANVPTQGRWTVVPPWFHGYLLQDQRFVSFGTPDNLSVLANGKVGRAAGFDIYMSNNVPNTTATKYRIIAGHSMAWSFAEQVTSVEGYRPQARFADAVKGLVVYGAKVVRPKALAVLCANNS